MNKNLGAQSKERGEKKDDKTKKQSKPFKTVKSEDIQPENKTFKRSFTEL